MGRRHPRNRISGETASNPYQPQDPYGQSPYGDQQQPPQAPQPGYGYPQQTPPPAAPYGQDPYAQQQQPPYGYPQQQGYGGYQQPGYGGYGPTGENNGIAIASMVVGIVSMVGICFFGGFLGIVAIGLGIPALNKSKTTGTGRNQAIAGIVLGALSLLLAIVFVIIAFSSSNFSGSSY